VARSRAGRPGLDSRHGQGWIILFATASRPTLGPTPSPHCNCDSTTPWSSDTSEADSCLDRQENSAFYGTRRFGAVFTKKTPLDPILSQVNPVHILTPQLSKLYFNTVFPSTPISPDLSLIFRFSNQFCVHSSSLPYVLHTPPISR